MQSETAWLHEHVIDFTSVGAKMSIQITVIVAFFVILAIGLVLMPGALRWVWRWWRGL
jgi:hypothetical protein